MTPGESAIRDADFREKVLASLATQEEQLKSIREGLEEMWGVVGQYEHALAATREEMRSHWTSCPLIAKVAELERVAAARTGADATNATWRGLVTPVLWVYFMALVILVLMHARELLPFAKITP